MPVITHSIDIHAPKAAVEEHYTNWESYPEFIDGLEEVTMKTPTDMQCKLRVAGLNFGYTAHVERTGEGKYAWHTTEGDVHHSGETQIEKIDDNTTRLRMTVDYKAPGPEIANKIAEWLNLAENQLQKALEKFKTHTEARSA